jgi:hypothetical protein
MQYLGTAFSLTLGGWRLRIRIDLDDAPEEAVVAHHYAPAQRAPSERVTSR